MKTRSHAGPAGTTGPTTAVTGHMASAAGDRLTVHEQLAGGAGHDPGDVGALLTHLEQRISALDQLQREIAGDAQALARAVSAQQVARPAPAVMSVSDAARDLGVSVSMLHKLLKDRRIGHLKVGTRTLLTPQHLAEFRRASEVEPARTRSEPAVQHRGSRRRVARAS